LALVSVVGDSGSAGPSLSSECVLLLSSDALEYTPLSPVEQAARKVSADADTSRTACVALRLQLCPEAG
jgi:hypothetical protein